MTRTLAVLVALAVAGGAVFTAPELAPAPRPKPVLYFPTTVGAKWVYQARDDEWTVVVTKVEEKDGVYIVTRCFLKADGKPGSENKVAVSERGLVLVEDGKADFDSPDCFLKFPYKEGKSWGTETAPSRFLKPERVKVPAGEFEAIPVEATSKIEQRVLRAVRWYAPGVGLIRRGLSKDGPGVVLKSFTPGRRE